MTRPIGRPVLRYHGGKYRLAEWVIGFFPPHRVYVEPFGGGASVLLQKARARTEVYNDLDREVVNLFRVLQDAKQAKQLAALLDLTPFAREEYERCYEPAKAPVERARRMIGRSFMGQSSKGIWQRSGFDTRVNPDGFASRVNAMAHVGDASRVAAARFRGVIIENDTAEKMVSRHDRPDTLFYVDPPYLLDRKGAGVYRHRMTEDDHRALGLTLRGARGMVVVSGYPSDLYDRDLFADWTRYERSAHADGARKRVEAVWLNPACSAALRASRSQLEIVG